MPAAPTPVAVGDLPMHIATEPRVAGLARGYAAMQVTDLAQWRNRLTKAKVWPGGGASGKGL